MTNGNPSVTGHLLHVTGLTKSYRAAGEQVAVLRGVNLAVAAGESVALTGESGSGKSTLLHLIAGLDAADGGEIRLADAQVCELSDAGRAELRRDRLGLVFQQFNLIQVSRWKTIWFSSRALPVVTTRPGTANWWSGSGSAISSNAIPSNCPAASSNGVMGETLVSGLLRAGRRPSELLLAERRAERAIELNERYGVDVVSNLEAAGRAETLILVVKPQDMGDLLDEIAPKVRVEQLVVSLAAGITTAFIESRLGNGVPVVRVMPNTPALVDEGMAAISPGSHCDEGHLVEAEELLAATGRVIRVPEKQQDAVTAISWLRPGIPVLRGRGDDRGRCAPGTTALDRLRARGPDRRRIGQAAARDRRASGRPQGAGDLARRHHRRRAPKARGPQGARRLPDRAGGGTRPYRGRWPPVRSSRVPGQASPIARLAR